MQLNPKNCKVIHHGKSNLNFSYLAKDELGTLNNIESTSSNVTFAPNLGWEENICASTLKASPSIALSYTNLK